MEPCWVLTCSLSWKLPSQMANTIGAGILPFLSLPLAFEMVSIYACVASGSVSPVCSQESLLLCFPLLPPTEANTIWQIQLFTKLSMTTFAHHGYSLSECPSQLQKFFFLTKGSIICILFQQMGHKIVRARPWSFSLYVPLSSSEKGLQERRVVLLELTARLKASLIGTVLMKEWVL